jgi:hypothetical protein
MSMDDELQLLEMRLLRVEEAAIAIASAVALTMARYDQSERMRITAFEAVQNARKELNTRNHEVVGLNRVATELLSDIQALKARRGQM